MKKMGNFGIFKSGKKLRTHSSERPTTDGVDVVSCFEPVNQCVYWSATTTRVMFYTV
jgi:hypothetical protein